MKMDTWPKSFPVVSVSSCMRDCSRTISLIHTLRLGLSGSHKGQQQLSDLLSAWCDWPRATCSCWGQGLGDPSNPNGPCTRMWPRLQDKQNKQGKTALTFTRRHEDSWGARGSLSRWHAHHVSVCVCGWEQEDRGIIFIMWANWLKRENQSSGNVCVLWEFIPLLHYIFSPYSTLRPLRSFSSSSHSKLKSKGYQALETLSLAVRSSLYTATFKSHLKIYHFRIAFESSQLSLGLHECFNLILCIPLISFIHLFSFSWKY